MTGPYFWQACRGQLRDRSVWAVMLALSWFFVRSPRGGLERATIRQCAFAALALIVLLTVTTKVPPSRVYFPILSFPLVVAALLAAGSSPSSTSIVHKFSPICAGAWRRRLPLARVVAVLLIASLVTSLHHQTRRSLIVRRDRRQLETFFAKLQPDGSQLYVCWEAALPFELISPLDNLAGWSRVPLVSLTWTQRTPWQEVTKAKFQTGNLAKAICERKDVVLIANPNHRSLFTTFAKEHYGAEVEFVESLREGERLVAGHFRQVGLPQQTPAGSASVHSNVTAR